MIGPEARLARRVVEKYNLAPPVDVEELIGNYAELTFAAIPVEGADGISLNLKVPGKKTRVIVNSLNPTTRQRFTMAHELGHVLIPWHTGSIIDNIDTEHEVHEDYWQIESEANSFAAELLMPHRWIELLLSKNNDLAACHAAIFLKCETSPLAAAIRLTQMLPKNIVYAVKRDGMVEISGRSDGTIAPALQWESPFPKKAFDYAEKHFSRALSDRELHWWILPAAMHFEIDDDRDWREILDSILEDIEIPAHKREQEKKSINGVVAYANSCAKRESGYGVESLAAACVQRLKDRPEFKRFVSHKDFHAFVKKKAEDLAARLPK